MQAEKQQAANDGPATPFTVRNKDAPAVLPWRQLAFDPDDESLPVVTEVSSSRPPVKTRWHLRGNLQCMLTCFYSVALRWLRRGRHARSRS